MVDTADVYGDGRSEEIIGGWFASRTADVTERVVLATKGRFPAAANDRPNGVGLSARHLTRALDASLRRLGLAAVDLYQVHAFDALTPLEETLRTLDGFIRAGKIRYWGLSKLHRLAADQGRAPGPGAEHGRAGHRPAAVQPAGQGRPSGRSCPPRPTPGWACCPGARWAAAGCPASTGGTSGPPGLPGSARTPTAA